MNSLPVHDQRFEEPHTAIAPCESDDQLAEATRPALISNTKPSIGNRLLATGPLARAMFLLVMGTIGYHSAIKPARERAEFQTQLERVSRILKMCSDYRSRSAADIEEIEAMHELLVTRQIGFDPNAKKRSGLSDTPSDAEFAAGPIDRAIRAIRTGQVDILWNADPTIRWSDYYYVGYESSIAEKKSLVLLSNGTVALFEPKEFQSDIAPIGQVAPPSDELKLRVRKVAVSGDPPQ